MGLMSVKIPLKGRTRSETIKNLLLQIKGCKWIDTSLVECKTYSSQLLPINFHKQPVETNKQKKIWIQMKLLVQIRYFWRLAKILQLYYKTLPSHFEYLAKIFIWIYFACWFYHVLGARLVITNHSKKG